MRREELRLELEDQIVPEPVVFPAQENVTVSEFVIPLLLDIEAHHSDDAICQMVSSRFGVSFGVDDLRELYTTDEFKELWPLVTSGDPKIDVARHAFKDLLPIAVGEMRTMLMSNSTADTVKLNLIKLVLDMSGADKTSQALSTKEELMRFLGDRGITQVNIGNLNVNSGYDVIDNALALPGSISLIAPIDHQAPEEE